MARGGVSRERGMEGQPEQLTGICRCTHAPEDGVDGCLYGHST
jgi:hypothetical protein